MCQSQADGGKRCTYSDQVSNVRKKALYKHRNDWDRRRKAEAAVNAWKNENKDIVAEHLPEQQPFQAKPNRKRVPEHLLNLMTKNSRTPVTGLPEEERKAATQKMYDDQEAWVDTLSRSEENAFRHYTMTGFELTNSHLRRSGMKEIIRDNPFYRNEDRTEEIKEGIQHLDEALSKAPKQDRIRKVYRYFKVPAGVTPAEYITRYFKEGEAFKDRGYMSTTADPEFIMAHLHKQNGGTQNHNYVVMEILTKQGASLQTEAISRSGDIQSLEKEYLLPRNTKLRIVGSRENQTFAFASNRDDLKNQYYRSYENHFREGNKMRFPLIQLVDEKLISGD